MIYNPDEHRLIITSIIWVCLLVWLSFMTGAFLIHFLNGAVSMFLIGSLFSVVMFVMMAALILAELLRVRKQIKTQNQIIDKQIIYITDFMKGNSK